MLEPLEKGGKFCFPFFLHLLVGVKREYYYKLKNFKQKLYATTKSRKTDFPQQS